MITHCYLYTRSIFGIQQVLAKNCTWNKVEMGKSHILRVIFHNILSCGIRNWKHAMFFCWFTIRVGFPNSDPQHTTQEPCSWPLRTWRLPCQETPNLKHALSIDPWEGLEVVYQMLHQSTWPKCDHSKGICKVHQRMIRIKVIKLIWWLIRLSSNKLGIRQRNSTNNISTQLFIQRTHTLLTKGFQRKNENNDWNGW